MPANKIREQIRADRRAVSPTDRAAWSSSICQRIVTLDQFLMAKRVAGFLAFDGEADPLDAMVAAVDQDKEVYVPTIVAKRTPLKFVRWTPGCAMRKNKFGINEPVVPESEWLDGRELDFVITPLVAFDESRNRIGVGGGFYDRTFEFLNSDAGSGSSEVVKSDSQIETDHLISTFLMGCAFELQKVESISAKEWDVQLHGVATEITCY